MNVGDTHSIDLLNLYDWLAADDLSAAAEGELVTKYGNKLVLSDDDHCDLYLPNNAALGAMDGEEVEIIGFDDYRIILSDVENEVVCEFELSLEEAFAAGIDAA